MDLELKYYCRAINAACTPYVDAYLDTIRRQSQGPLGTIQWFACRAAGEWGDAISEMCNTLNSPDVLDELGIPQSSGHPDMPHDDLSEMHWNRAVLFVSLVVELAASRAWGRLGHSVCLPSLFVGVWHPDKDVARECLQRARRVWTQVLRAVAIAEGDAHDGAARGLKKFMPKLLADLYYKNQPIVKEMCLIAQRANWDLDSAAFTPLWNDIWFTYSTPGNTKFVCGDVFGCLQDLRGHNKNKKLNRFSSWYHAANWKQLHGNRVLGPDDVGHLEDCSAAPDTQVRGHNYGHMTLSSDDFRVPLDVPSKKMREGLFTAAGHKPHQDLKFANLTLPANKRQGRPAGQQAGFRMAAASEYLLSDSVNAWYCCLMGKGFGFLRPMDSGVFLSLGAQSWAWVGIPLEKHVVGGVRFYSVKENTKPEVLNNFACDDTSAWRGIPWVACPPHDVPPGVGLVICWKQLDEPELPLKFAIQNAMKLNRNQLAALCKGMHVPKLPGDDGRHLKYNSMRLNCMFVCFGWSGNGGAHEYGHGPVTHSHTHNKQMHV